MIVCSCNVLSDTAIRDVLETSAHPPTRVVDVYRQLGCRAKCGGCATSIRSLIRDADRQGERTRDDGRVEVRAAAA